MMYKQVIVGNRMRIPPPKSPATRSVFKHGYLGVAPRLSNTDDHCNHGRVTAGSIVMLSSEGARIVARTVNI